MTINKLEQVADLTGLFLIREDLPNGRHMIAFHPKNGETEWSGAIISDESIARLYDVIDEMKNADSTGN